MQEGTLLTLITLASIIFISPYFSRLFKLPIAPVEIILGVIVGNVGFLTHSPEFKLVSDVGFYFLMFLAGMEVDMQMFLQMSRRVVRLTIAYLALLYILATIVTAVFGLHPLFIIIIPIMSVGMIFALIKEHGRDNEWLNLSMLVGSLGEVLSIVLLTIVSAYFSFGTFGEFWFSILYLVIFLGLSILGFKLLDVLFWWLPSLKVVLMPEYDKNEKDVRLSIALFLFIIATMVYLRLEVAFGAFVAGMFIATFFDHKTDLPQKLGNFGFGFLVPIFFIYIGSTLKLEKILDLEIIKTTFFIIICMIVCRFISSLIFINYLKLKATLLYALSHCMPLTLLVAAATIAYKSGNIDESYYSSFILASLFEAVFAMIMIKIVLNLQKRRQNEILS
ncbi:MAG: cation:proton antiporter [Campylobacter sp.]|nr:cation:proton antiporter [Campylobacter sp.]